MTKNTLFQITPLGGLGKVGGNSIIIGDNSTGFLIDAGIEFPYESAYGIDYLVPSFDQYLIPETLVITHGHEDHIGAIPYLLSIKPDIKIYAPPFAASLIRHKLNYLKLSCQVKTYNAFEAIEINSYKVIPIPLPHSIPDNFGLLIKAPDVCCFYASDFKLNNNSSTKNSLEQLANLSRGYKQKILMADSTNILEQTAIDDSVIKNNISNTIEDATGRVLVTCFSSNIGRIESLVEVAKKTKRKIIPYGKSMKSYIDCACDHKYLDEKCFTSAESTDLDAPNSIILISGCQGDFTSTLKRIASGDDPSIQPTNSDTFIYSAKAIPGNESQINHIFDLLSTKGVKIISSNSIAVHTSGHPARDQLLQLYKSFTPNIIIPVHGSHYHLKTHASHCEQVYPSAKSYILKNGDSFTLDPKQSVTIGNGFKPYFIQAGQIISPPVIKQRRKMASLGVVILSIRIDTIRSRQLKFDFSLMGLPELSTENSDKFTSVIQGYFRKNKVKDFDSTRSNLTATIRTFFKGFINIKPVIVIHFI